MPIEFSERTIIPANGQKIPAIDGSATGYIITDEYKTYVLAEKGQPNGLATLDENGKLVSTQLPDFANDVLAFDSIASFPATGADGVLYIAKDINTLYRWDDSQYTSVNTDTSALEQRVDELETEIDQKANKTETYTKEEVDALVEQAKPADYDEVKERVSTLETEVEGLNTEVSTLKAENTQQAKDIAMLKYANEGKTYIMEESDRDGYSVDVKPATVTGEAFGEAVLKAMEGRDVCWNQLKVLDNTRNWTIIAASAGATMAHDSTGKQTASFASAPTGLIQMYKGYEVKTISGHVYFMAIDVTASFSTSNATIRVYPYSESAIASLTANRKATISHVFTATNGQTTGTEYGILVRDYSNVVAGSTLTASGYALVDLTQMFPTDTPTSLTDPRITWLKAYLADHPEYNEGEIVNNNVTSVVSEGRNLWDEQWEVGDLSASTGEEISSTGVWRSKGYIKVEQGKTYYFKASTSTYVRTYDSSKRYLDALKIQADSTFVPTNYTYIRLRFAEPGYNGNVCINVSDSKNGTYTPYRTPSTLSLPSICSSLHGVGTAKDKVGFVNDKDGKRWLERKADKTSLATLAWSQHSSVSGLWYAQVADAVNNATFISNVPYAQVSPQTGGGSSMPDKTCGFGKANNYFYVRDSDLASAPTGDLVFELATPQLLDVTSLVPEEPSFPIEDGGTLTFVNENRVATPSRISMPVKLGGTV